MQRTNMVTQYVLLGADCKAMRTRILFRQPSLDNHTRIPTTAAIHVFRMLRGHMADEEGDLAESSGAVQACVRILVADICAELSVAVQVRAGLCAGTSSKCHGEILTFAIRSLGCSLARIGSRRSIILSCRGRRTRGRQSRG